MYHILGKVRITSTIIMLLLFALSRNSVVLVKGMVSSKSIVLTPNLYLSFFLNSKENVLNLVQLFFFLSKTFKLQKGHKGSIKWIHMTWLVYSKLSEAAQLLYMINRSLLTLRPYQNINPCIQRLLNLVSRTFKFLLFSVTCFTHMFYTKTCI